jgi:hypothetical protein
VTDQKYFDKDGIILFSLCNLSQKSECIETGDTDRIASPVVGFENFG